MPPPELDPDHMPRHVAIIMDGNGRWANERGLSRNAGHEAGEDALFDTVEGALELGIECLTVYAFSTENWKRPSDEVEFLMNFNRTLLKRRRDELDDRDVQVVFLGRRDPPVPPGLVELMEETEQQTADNQALVFAVAFNYGGRAEIVDAARRLAAEHATGELQDPGGIDADAFQQYLYQPSLPPVDLVIRTSGEQRLSNFLLWQSAYAELVFTETLWPDFDRHELAAAVGEFQRRERRFGDAQDSPT